MARTAFYDSNQISISIGDFIIDSGFADGEFLSIAPDSEKFLKVVGTDGETARSKTNNSNYTATLRLLQTSEANSTLTALMNLDLDSDNGAGVGVFRVVDLSGTQEIQAQDAWIENDPTQAFDRSATVREWTIALSNVRITGGGN